MADGGPSRPIVPPISSKRRCTDRDRDRRSSSAEFVILADDGSQHLIEAVIPPYKTNHIDIEETSFRMTRSRARDGTAASQPGNRASTSSATAAGSLVEDQAVDSHESRAPSHPGSELPNDPNYWNRVLGLDSDGNASVMPTVGEHERSSSSLTVAQVEVQLRHRIALLEAQNGTLQQDNAALGIAITDSNNIPYNDEDRLLDLVKMTRITRGALIRLMNNGDFLERWRLRSRGDRSRGNRNRSGGSESGRYASGRGESQRDGRGRGRGGSRWLRCMWTMRRARLQHLRRISDGMTQPMCLVW